MLGRKLKFAETGLRKQFSTKFPVAYLDDVADFITNVWEKEPIMGYGKEGPRLLDGHLTEFFYVAGKYYMQQKGKIKPQWDALQKNKMDILNKEVQLKPKLEAETKADLKKIEDEKKEKDEAKKKALNDETDKILIAFNEWISEKQKYWKNEVNSYRARFSDADFKKNYAAAWTLWEKERNRYITKPLNEVVSYVTNAKKQGNNGGSYITKPLKNGDSYVTKIELGPESKKNLETLLMTKFLADYLDQCESGGRAP